jgi:hypothetical protein
MNQDTRAKTAWPICDTLKNKIPACEPGFLFQVRALASTEFFCQLPGDAFGR